MVVIKDKNPIFKVDITLQDFWELIRRRRMNKYEREWKEIHEYLLSHQIVTNAMNVMEKEIKGVKRD